jgi:hypothetical protein
MADMVDLLARARGAHISSILIAKLKSTSLGSAGSNPAGGTKVIRKIRIPNPSAATMYIDRVLLEVPIHCSNDVSHTSNLDLIMWLHIR